MALRSELGWQHQLGGVARHAALRFEGSDAAFTVDSVPVSRDGAVVKVGTAFTLDRNLQFSLDYGGGLSGRYQDNSLNAGVRWTF
ncbi:autotransporter outer membrane beta-barrel domain-containing protein [Serratia marcescens]|uniref:autotransporter outer membrane beta-barrel domain-containing protein n=1 Tax=Serratia marcescens TaxID=615 RepID=UPI003F86CD13